MKERPEERLLQAWRGTAPPRPADGGRARFLGALEDRRAGRRSPRSRRIITLAALAAAAAIALVVLLSLRAPVVPASSAEALVGVWLETDKNEMSLAFRGGTEVVVAPSSRARVESATAAGADLLLERGRVKARVQHAAGSTFRFLAGPYDVHVTGTELDVEWDPSSGAFSVDVHDGSVVVRGPDIDPPRIVRKGGRLATHVPRARPSATAVLPSAAPPTPSAPEPPPSAIVEPPPPSPTSEVPWTVHEDRGNYAAAFAAAKKAGLASLHETLTADQLLRFALVARASGHRETERDTLRACRRRFPRTEASAIAAYELGRASPAAEAVTWFDTYLREKPGGPLAREALGRLMEAESLAGNKVGAREAAERYLARFPDGPEASVARRIVDGDEP